jgi:hypothetical protein
MIFLQRLLTDWRDALGMGLLSVDLLLTDPGQPDGAVWPGFGVTGEAAAGQTLDPAYRQNLEQALRDALDGASGEDGLLLLFCGHGFSRAARYFVLSDFARNPLDPWSQVVDLDGLAMGLRQVPPRTQWLFWDCCADIPSAILDALGTVGTPIIQPTGSRISSAAATYGPLVRFGIASSPVGEQAFGIPNAPSRFIEMLVEAIEGAGATKRQSGLWWVDDRGIVDALQTYVQRHPALQDSQFYTFVTPFSSDAPQRIRFRQLPTAPTSLLIAASAPQRTALKAARVRIVRDGAAGDEAALFTQEPPGRTAVIHVPLPALQNYTITAVFNNGAGPIQIRSAFADLPLAEEVEFQSP